MDPITPQIIAGLIVAAITGIFAWSRGKIKGAREERNKCKAQIYKFIATLEETLEKAHSATNTDDLVIEASAFIMNRDRFKAQLDDLSKLLNSDMDKLSVLVKDKAKAEVLSSSDEIHFLINKIKASWPGKKVEIDAAMVKLLASLGIR